MARLIAVIAGSVAVLVVAAVVALADPAEAQDRTSERLDALETRVADLVERIARLEGSPAASPVTAASREQSPQSYSITGDLLLRQPLPGMMSAVGPCVGHSGFDDIHGGATVVVRDGVGAVIATGALGDGEWVEEPNASDIAELDWNCLFPIEVRNVPRSDFYEVEVGHRGGLTYSFAELDAADWTVHLVLGNND